jgi:hypothetical protein
MASRAREFVNERSRELAERARRLGAAPVEIARSTALKSAGRIQSLKEPARALSRSGVRLTAISQSTAQSLIELQAEIVDSVLSNAAAQLERAAQSESVMDLARDQADVLRATRQRIIEDLNKAVAIFRDAGGNVRGAAVQAYGGVAEQATRRKSAAKKAVRKQKRPARKTAARGRKSKA